LRQQQQETHMTRTDSTRTRGFRRTLIGGVTGAIALGAMAVPALADVVVYGQPGYYYTAPSTVYVPAPTYTYTYPAPVYTYERGPGVYVDTPILNLGIGIH
jgi:hypothetical protein